MIRHATAILVAALLIGLPLFYGARRLDETHDNRVSVWLPHGHRQTRDFDWFTRSFGTDQVILVSWDGCRLDDPRLECFAAAVEADRRVGDSGRPWVGAVWTGQRVAERLMAPPANLSRRQVRGRLQGVLIGPDGESTCAVLVLNDVGNRHRGAALERLQTIAQRQCRIPAEHLHLGGDIVSARAIDVEGDRAIGRLLPTAVALSFLAAWVSLRSWRLSLIVFILAQYCAFGLKGVMFFTGGHMNLLVTLVPVLVYVLALSASIHISNYYRDAVRRHSGDSAPWIALRSGWRPCSISALTTSLGLASLLVSHIPAVRTFGTYGSLGVLLAFGALIILLPAALARFPEHARESALVSRHKLFDVWLPSAIFARRASIVAVFVVATVAVGLGALRIETSVSPLRFLPHYSRVVSDARWLEEHIGPLTHYEIVVGFPEDAPWSFGARMRIVREIQRDMHRFPQVKGSTSAATYAPPLGPIGKVSTVGRAQRTILDHRLAEHAEVFEREGCVAHDGGRQWWRVTLRLAGMDAIDLKEFRRQVSQRVEATLKRAGVDNRSDIALIQTGTAPLFFAAQRELLESLVLSFVAALVTITIVMMLATGSMIAGLIVMLPNVFPAAIVFGAMGWGHIVVDIGSMMTASVALGIAVDDTLHFLTWYERGWAETRSRVLALRQAFRTSAPAMLQTTAIAGLGMAVFAFSDFQPVARFGMLMSSLLVAALVGDLIFLPAILASPLGNYFGRRKTRGTATD